MLGKLFLAPTGGLGNRLLMIASALRICRQSDLEFEVVWTDQESPFSERRHYWGPFSTYFESDLLQRPFPLAGEDVCLPKSTRDDRFVLRSSDLINKKLYINFWTHCILKETDLVLSREVLTSEIISCLRDICKPSYGVSKYAGDNYPSEVFSPKEKDVEPDFIGLHVRKGAVIDPSDQEFLRLHNIPNIVIVDSTLKILRQTGLQKIFISSQVKGDVEEIGALLAAHGTEVFSHHPGDFPNPPINNQNRPEHVLKAVNDFLGLASSRCVISTTATTFGALAALLTGRRRFIITENRQIVETSSLLLTGAGL